MKQPKVNEKMLKAFYIDKALPALREMLANVTVIPFPHAGVCPNVLWMVRHEQSAHIDHFKYKIRELGQTWEHFSGDPMYPIPSTELLEPPRECYLNSDLWEGKQLEMRCSFMLHLVHRIKEDVSE